MADYTFSPQAALDISTGNLVLTEGLSGEVFETLAAAQAQTGQLTVTLSGGVAATEVPVSRLGQTALFTAAFPAVYWRSGAYIALLVSFDNLVQSAERAVWTINGQAADEGHDVTIQTGGVDDAGLAALIEDPASASGTSLRDIWGPGFLFLDLDDVPPPGTPDGTILLRTAGGGTPPPVAVTYAQDDFERIVAAGSLGAASGGGTYSIDIASDWSVGSGGARWIAPSAGTRLGSARLSTYSQSSVEMTGAVSQHGAGAAGQRYFTLQPRRTVGTSGTYGANITLRGSASTRPLQVDLGLEKSGSVGDLQTPVTGVVTMGAMGDLLRFRVRVEQVDASSTRIRARVWLDGTQEPATWQRDIVDSTADMQVAGHLQMKVQQNASETIASEIRIHEFVVQSVTDA